MIEFQHADARILLSIARAQRDEGASMVGLIGSADTINHAFLPQSTRNYASNREVSEP